MARTSFALNTEPHIVEIGDVELKFRPEVMGDEFLDSYETLQERQRATGITPDNPAGASASALREATAAVRAFLKDLLMPESVKVFEDLKLPDRILVQVLEWVITTYAGGADGQRPTGPSRGSSPASPPRGTRGRGSSR